MNVYLAGSSSRKALFEKHNPLYILESFFYIEPWQIKKLHELEGFILDSGAFTFMNNAKNETNFDEYVEKYIQFIKKNKIKMFLELDIDVVVGYERVKEYRKYIEKETGRQCIPVWHKSRGIDDYLEMVKNYEYVAIGGIVTKEITREQWKYFPYLIREAKKQKAKVHGLGFTATSELHKYHFDSIDSTSWLSASRFGAVQTFSNGIIKTVKTPEGKKVKHYKILDDYVVGEWIKFQEYADVYL